MATTRREAIATAAVGAAAISVPASSQTPAAQRGGMTDPRAKYPKPQPVSVTIARTSEQVYGPSPDLYDYAETKAATMNFVKSLAKQLGPKGIRVNGVAPGPVWTPLQISGGASGQGRHLWRHRAPRPTWKPAELAGIYVRLQQVLAHTQAAAVDESFAMSGVDQNLKKSAQAAPPMFRDHPRMAQGLRVRVGGF